MSRPKMPPLLNIVVGLVVLFVVPLFAADAWAWGAAMHLKLAEHVLLNRHLLPAQLGALLGQYPTWYAYGNLIADLILGKRYGIDFRDHSHNWRVGWRLLEGAETPEMQAAMWGYLSHLAADVVAHQVFVPTKIAAVRNGLIRGHSGWEIAFDADWHPEYPHLALEVTERVSEVVDPYLMGRLRETLFSHRNNRRIFRWTLKLQKYRTWERLVREAARRTPHAVDDETRTVYFELSMNAVWSCLHRQREATVTHFDPTGHRALELAARTRRGDAEVWHEFAGAEGPLAAPELRGQLALPLTELPKAGLDEIELERPALADLI